MTLSSSSSSSSSLFNTIFNTITNVRYFPLLLISGFSIGYLYQDYKEKQSNTHQYIQYQAKILKQQQIKQSQHNDQN
jgi:hypothetical protein